MLTISNLGKFYGAQTLFTGATVAFVEGNRYGIVGANGSGKSTLLKIIAGQEEASEGTLDLPKRVRVAVLRQDHFQYEEVPILDVVLQGNEELYEAMQEKEQILARSHIEFDADRYTELEDIVLANDGYSVEARAAEVLEGLGIEAALHHEPLSVLSGGFKLRVLLAQTLAGTPDLLLLDEPTNHLDILSIKWLESFLQSFKGCVLIVSHDRQFLNAVCTHIVDVDYQQVTPYTGDYEDFERQKVELRERKESEIAKREAEIEHHKQFIERFRAKATKARQAQSKAKQLARITIEKLPETSRRYPRFQLKSQRSSGKQVLELENIGKTYGDNRVLHRVSMNIINGERVAIIGPNGIGKSTLLKIMMGLLPPDTGTCTWGYETHPGYFSQDHAEIHEAPEQSLESWFWNQCPDRGIGEVRARLAAVLFSKEEVEKKLSALSGGEATRLIFARLAVQEPNVLVLDEPTNHLDLEGIESLARGLEAYDGTLIFVSHDRWFVSRLANRIIELTPKGLIDYRGTYTEYLEHSARLDHLDREAVVDAHKAQSKKKRKRSRR